MSDKARFDRETTEPRSDRPYRASSRDQVRPSRVTCASAGLYGPTGPTATCLHICRDRGSMVRMNQFAKNSSESTRIRGTQSVGSRPALWEMLIAAR